MTYTFTDAQLLEHLATVLWNATGATPGVEPNLDQLELIRAQAEAVSAAVMTTIGPLRRELSDTRIALDATRIDLASANRNRMDTATLLKTQIEALESQNRNLQAALNQLVVQAASKRTSVRSYLGQVG